MVNLDLFKSIKELPNLPGVYLYFDKNNVLLYIGKAKQLKKRVSSYFNKKINDNKIDHMVRQINKIEFKIVQSETEALLLEYNLIKTLKPKYNIIFRDDKSYPYLVFSDDKFPRIFYERKLKQIKDLNNNYYGPFPNTKLLKENIELIQKIFKIRTCNNIYYKNRSRPCLLYQINRCLAPCVNKINVSDYNANIKNSKDLLNGKINEILNKLNKQMSNFSNNLEFEKAIKIREKINKLKQFYHNNKSQNVETGDIKNIDIITLLIKENLVCINLAILRNGRYLGDNPFFFQIKDFFYQNENSFLESFIINHYNKLPFPDNLILNIKPSSFLINYLKQNKLNLIKCYKGKIKNLIKMLIQNTNQQLTIKLNNSQNIKNKINELIKILELNKNQIKDNLLIECFDVSHTSGKNTKVSCIVFENNKFQTYKYRIFNINNIINGDDYEALNQALFKRYKSNKNIPDLIFIDGGIGQFNIAKKIFEQLNLPLNKLVGIKKDKTRKVGLEELIYINKKISLNSDNPALLLIAKIRDEAHRFAISEMRKARINARIKNNQLEEIKGIGKNRRLKLLKYFKSIKNISKASINDLIQVDGIAENTAKNIYNKFNNLQ